jgi:hypothetical protein
MEESNLPVSWTFRMLPAFSMCFICSPAQCLVKGWKPGTDHLTVRQCMTSPRFQLRPLASGISCEALSQCPRPTATTTVTQDAVVTDTPQLSCPPNTITQTSSSLLLRFIPYCYLYLHFHPVKLHQSSITILCR